MANNKSAFCKSALLLVVLVVAAVLGLNGINSHTAPIIEKNASAQLFAPLYQLLPEAAGFEKLYLAGEETELVEIPETVQGIFSETSGMGYVLRLSTTKGYTGQAVELTMAVDNEGKIFGMELTAYPETKDFGADYPGSFVGQDSTLADVGLVAGVTYSSAAFKNAVADGFTALIANGLVKEATKSPEQILGEMLIEVYPGIVNKAGIAQYEETIPAEGQFVYIRKIMKNMNEAGYAYVTAEGDNQYLAICNLTGGAKIFDLDGNDVSGDAAFAAMLDEVRAHTADNVKVPKKAAKKLRKMVSDEAEYETLDLSNVFNSVTSAYKITDAGVVYYGFVANSFGYNNLPMEVYALLDESGAIVNFNVDELIFFGEYFHDYVLEEDSYLAGFVNLTTGSWTGEQAIISGATFSSDGVADATSDIFEAFGMIQNGGENV